MNKFSELERLDSEFLAYIAAHGGISIEDLHKVLLFSDSTYVEFPIWDDENEYPYLSDSWNAEYRWIDEYPLRISHYGDDIDFKFGLMELSDNAISGGRLTGLTVDFGIEIIENPNKLFSAINSALNIYGPKLALQTLCFCSLQSPAYRRSKENFFASLLEVRLPHLEELVLNRFEISDIKFIAAPRLISFSVIDSGISEYDLTKLYSLEEINIGDKNLSHIKLSYDNIVKNITISKGDSPSVRERKHGIGCSLADLISGIGFSTENLKIIGAGISHVDLSVLSKLKILNLKNNPIKELNLDWVPLLEYLNLEGTGVEKVNTSALPKLKQIFLN